MTGNLTYVNELNQAGWAKLLGCSFTDGTLVDGEVLGLRRAMLQVPVGIADLICSSSCPSELATPLSVAKACGVQPTEAIAGEPAGEPALCSLEQWRRRGAGWRNDAGYAARTTVFEVEAARLAFKLGSMREVPAVCRHAARMLCPDKDTSGIKYPNHEQIRQTIIRLDLLNMLWQRRFRLSLYY